jgi:hypothetical protein
VVAAEFPAQVVARDELAQPRVERADVIVLEVDLDEGLPVVVALVQVGAIEDVPVEVEHAARGSCQAAAAAEVVGDSPPAAVLEQQAMPALQRVAAQVQARVVLEVRRAGQAAFEVVGPAVQRADDVAAALAAPAAAQHHRLAVPADVGDERDAPWPGCRAHEGASFGLLGQRQVVADLGQRQLVPEVDRSGLEDQLLFRTEQALVEVAVDGKLRLGARVERDAEVRHDPNRSSRSVEGCPDPAPPRRLRLLDDAGMRWQAMSRRAEPTLPGRLDAARAGL